MDDLDGIAERIRTGFEARNNARDTALQRARTMTRHCAHAIRAVHRAERDKALAEIAAARAIVDVILDDLAPHPALYHAGYTQDAMKEFAEANIVYALVGGEPLPSPQELRVEDAAYLNGLAEAVGELRRRCLDILRHDHSEEAERLMDMMEDIYSVLVTMDFPEAITAGLRRSTDLVRGMIERTRGDITTSLRQQKLQQALREVSEKLS